MMNSTLFVYGKGWDQRFSINHAWLLGIGNTKEECFRYTEKAEQQQQQQQQLQQTTANYNNDNDNDNNNNNNYNNHQI